MSEPKNDPRRELYIVAIVGEDEILLPPMEIMATDNDDAKYQAVGHYARENPEASLATLRVRAHPF
jgi:hypothetical protein